jgi:hypothetical protein
MRTYLSTAMRRNQRKLRRGRMYGGPVFIAGWLEVYALKQDEAVVLFLRHRYLVEKKKENNSIELLNFNKNK